MVFYALTGKKHELTYSLMQTTTHSTQSHIGLSPYALVFRGQKKMPGVGLRLISFSRDRVNDTLLDTVGEIQPFMSPDVINWLNVDGLDNAAMMEELGALFAIPLHILSDVMNPYLRPQIEEFDNGFFVTMKMLAYHEKNARIEVENLSVVVAGNTLITFQERPGKVFDPLRERIRKHTGRMTDRGTDYLCFALLDIVVDHYTYLISQLEEQIESVEELLTTDPSKEIPEQINAFKREVRAIRKSVKPGREVILNLNKMDSDLISDSNHPYFKELQDNINEASELLDNCRDVLSDQLNTYHSIMSARLNDVMMILTMFSVVFIPLTFIVGVYGTNFENIPELKWRYAYPLMWVVMFVIALGMLYFFRRKKWF